jgi:maleate isomerase
MSGRPARVGLMIPSSNTMMEVDFTRDLPPGAALHTARMFMQDTTPAGESRMLDEFALPAARDLGTARPDVVVFGCTSAGALRGNDYDTELCERISELTGAPTVSTIGAVRTAIEASGAASIGVITPYVDELNEKIKASIEADGTQVAAITGLGITDNFEIAEVEPDEIVAFAVRALGGLAAGGHIDLVFASCTNFGAMAARPAGNHQQPGGAGGGRGPAAGAGRIARSANGCPGLRVRRRRQLRPGGAAAGRRR